MVKDDLHQAGTGFGACPGDMWRNEQLMAVLYSKQRIVRLYRFRPKDI